MAGFCQRVGKLMCGEEPFLRDSAVKRQEEFEAMKKKTRNMLLGLAAYKAMH